jgi:hypothetical protein
MAPEGANKIANQGLLAGGILLIDSGARALVAKMQGQESKFEIATAC